jgi:hypothetical protein
VVGGAAQEDGEEAIDAATAWGEQGVEEDADEGVADQMGGEKGEAEQVFGAEIFSVQEKSEADGEGDFDGEEDDGKGGGVGQGAPEKFIAEKEAVITEADELANAGGDFVKA